MELSAAEQQEILDSKCGQDLNFRHRVKELLKAQDKAGSYLDKLSDDIGETSGAGPSGKSPDVTSGLSGQSSVRDDFGTSIVNTVDIHHDGTSDAVIAELNLKEKIGEGGMGEVWVAKQSKQTKRAVALKLIKTGMHPG